MRDKMRERQWEENRERGKWGGGKLEGEMAEEN